MYYEVIPTKLFRGKSAGLDGGILTYTSDTDLLPGHLVTVPLGRATCTGIVYKKLVQSPDFKCKPIIKLLYTDPLPPHLLRAIFWLADYYLCPLPVAATLILPSGVEKNGIK